MIYFDTETCGLHGPTVLIQWARDDGEINLHSVFTSPIRYTLDLIEEFVVESNGVTGFNLAFDWFHICQTYTTLYELQKKVGLNACPEDYINQYALAEPAARDGLCIKPETAHDIMLHARKGPYQNTMDRADIRIKRVPTALAFELAKELDKRIPIKDIYFMRKKDFRRRWQVVDLFDDFGDLLPDFKDVVLRFAPTSALKALAVDALNIPPSEVLTFGQVEVDPTYRPVEQGYAPFALAPYRRKKKDKTEVVQPSPDFWYGKWPQVIEYHISHWAYNRIARKYASDDVKYTRDLYHHFGDSTPGDDDSILACMVGASRWRGYAIDKEKIQNLIDTAREKEQDVRERFNYNSPSVCRKYLEEVLDETETLVMRVRDKITTKGTVLEELCKWKKCEVCDTCQGAGVLGSRSIHIEHSDPYARACPDCNEGLIETDLPHPAAERAREILDARHAKKEIENYEKLLFAGRFHASYNIIGARSSRMSGRDGLNPQGIRRATETRGCFPLVFDSDILCGGDFDAFEVSIVDADYGDPVLHEDLVSGKKIHGLFGQFFFDKTYEEIMATKGLPGEQDQYGRSKNGVFAILYFGNEYTLQTRVGISPEQAEHGYQEAIKRYQVFGRERRKYMQMFCSMQQPGGIGTRVEWHEPAEFIESMFGFRRYFTLENQICKALFDLAENPPKNWQTLRIAVTRRDRVQTACGALRSALFAAAFAIQGSNMRAAGNHRIQSTGAQITKFLQRRIWDVQPPGISKWRVQPFNSHDEILSPTHPRFVSTVKEIVDKFIIEYRKHIPLLGMKWKTDLKSWADK